MTTVGNFSLKVADFSVKAGDFLLKVERFNAKVSDFNIKAADFNVIPGSLDANGSGDLLSPVCAALATDVATGLGKAPLLSRCSLPRIIAKSRAATSGELMKSPSAFSRKGPYVTPLRNHFLSPSKKNFDRTRIGGISIVALAESDIQRRGE